MKGVSFAPSSYDDCLRLSDALESQCLPHSYVLITVSDNNRAMDLYTCHDKALNLMSLRCLCLQQFPKNAPLPLLIIHKNFTGQKIFLTFDSSSPFYHEEVSHWPAWLCRKKKWHCLHSLDTTSEDLFEVCPFHIDTFNRQTKCQHNCSLSRPAKWVRQWMHSSGLFLLFADGDAARETIMKLSGDQAI